ncbi:hypothetical protein ACFVJW_31020 [Streptomyces libani]|uniref:hypothetical protein n=1 Tax=Streptomyces nigrescens TaxID=1920 RepID=UPI003625FB92
MIEPYERALDEVPGAHPYGRSSRYSEVEIGVYRCRDGTEVRYAKRRLLPRLDDAAEETAAHTVSSGERPDQLGQRYFGDSGQWWQIADANPTLDPRELTDEPGDRIAVPLPGGFPGGMGGPGVRNG